jgi:hypothetical protein
MEVIIPHNNIKERVYIISLLCNQFLHLPINISVTERDIQAYVFIINEKKLIIKDFFFDRHRAPLSYLHLKNIPKNLNWLVWDEYIVNPIPIIYGDNYLKIEPNKIYCGADIFASAFFMLSRWEEILLPKDQFGRCDENEMFVVKHGLEKRPLVNEYVELLRFLLEKIGVDIPLQKKEFTPFITHDIDDLFRFESPKNFIRNIAGDILHRKSFRALSLTLKNYLKFRLGQIKDPFDTFDLIMDISEEFNFKNAFYFKASINGEYDATYDIFDPKVKKIISHIQNRGHEVGFHPSKNTFHNETQFKLEAQRLSSLGVNIKGGRQHFLLYDLPETIRVWNNNGMEYDAGLGFASHAGFRCGTCDEYPFFDIYQRKELSIKIRPLILMEGALFQFDKIRTLDSIEQEIKELIDIVVQNKGLFVFLWHNDQFNRYEALQRAPLYKKIVEYLYLTNINSPLIFNIGVMQQWLQTPRVL